MWSYFKTIAMQIPKIVVGLTATLYVTGLLISSIHLGNFGIQDFALARPTYLLVGVAATLFILNPTISLALVLLFPYFLYRGCRSFLRGDRKGSSVFFIEALCCIGGLGACGLIAVTTSIMYQYQQTEVSAARLPRHFFNWAIYLDDNFTSLPFIIIVGGGIISLSCFYLLYGSDHEKNTSKRSESPAHLKVFFLCTGSLIMSGMLILFLLEYSASIHRRARFEFGGGIPRIVDIQLNEEGAKSIKNLGLLPDAEGILQNVKLVHETSRSMYVLIPEAQWREGKNIAVEIPHAKIIAVGYRFTRK